MKKFMWLLLAFIPLSSVLQAKDSDPFAPTAKEVALLPIYCKQKHAAFKTPAGQIRWQNTFGEMWQHMHHYCFALNFVNRANQALDNPQKRKFNLQRSITNFDYILNRADKSFVLLPEANLKKGQVLLKQGKMAGAIALFNQAIAVKPDYTPAYASLSDYYKRLDNLEEARKVLEEGLKHKPKSKLLKKKMRKLEK